MDPFDVGFQRWNQNNGQSPDETRFVETRKTKYPPTKVFAIRPARFPDFCICEIWASIVVVVEVEEYNGKGPWEGVLKEGVVVVAKEQAVELPWVNRKCVCNQTFFLERGGGDKRVCVKKNK
jgi:hypothetical protein